MSAPTAGGLTALNILGAVGAVTSANATAFANNYGVLDRLTDQQKKAIRIVALTHLCLTVASVTYTTAAIHKTTLVSDAKALTQGLSKVSQATLDAVVDWDAARRSDTSVADTSTPTNVQDLLLEARDLLNLPEETQDRIIAMLQCRIARPS